MKFDRRFKVSLLVSGMFVLFSGQLLAADEITINTNKSITNIKSLSSIIGLKDDYAFKIAKKVILPNGKVKNRMAQYYQGIPVFGASVVATKLKSGEYTDLTGSYFTNIELDLKSTAIKLTKADVLNILKQKSIIKPDDTISGEQATLYIMRGQDKKAHVVYLTAIMIDGQSPSSPTAVIDAQTGKILEQWDGLTTSNGTGPGGNAKTLQYRYDGVQFPFLQVTETVPGTTCTMDSTNVATYNMNSSTSSATLHSFTCFENTYKAINGAFSPINDAHAFGLVTFNMYKDWFNSSPLNTKLKLRVHYGVNYENAFYDNISTTMTFGDGASTFYPLTALDVTAHEVSHGFTAKNSGLVYNKQPGGINEAFSDIAGEAAKYYNNPNKPEDQRNDWLVGATIMKPGAGTALRYFDDPTKDGRSIGNAANYYDGLDVHYSSGVFNKAFYTLAKKAGWNTQKAFSAFVLANQVYWNPNSDFVNAGCGVARAAKDLNLSQSDVISAFNVVGVNAACIISPPQPTPPTPELQNGVPVTDLAGAKDSQIYYVVKVPAGKAKLEVKMSAQTGSTGDADLYTKFGAKPTTSVWDCRPYSGGNNETCTVTAPAAGSYYVMIRGYAAYTKVSLVANIS